MFEGQPTCIVDVDLRGTTSENAQQTARSLLAIGAIPRFRLDSDGSAAFIEALPRDPVRWVVGGVAELARLIAAPRPFFTLATLEIDGLSTADVYSRLLIELFDKDISVFVRPIQPHGEDVLAAVSGPWLGTHRDGDEAWWVPVSPMRVASDGIVNGKPIGTYSRSELAAIAGAAEGFLPRFPVHATFHAPDGRVVREYFAGGSQYVGHSTTQRMAIVALGFADGGFDEWFATLLEQRGEFVFPTFGMREAGVLNNSGRAKLVPASRRMTDAVVVAVGLLTGNRGWVERFLGIQGDVTKDWMSTALPVDPLDDGALAKIVFPAQDLFASACGVIAASRVPVAIRSGAASTLAFLGGEHAVRVARWIEARCTELGDRHRKKYRNAPAKRVRESAETPRGALANLRDQIARLSRAGQ
jgi:hypothetical protein